jgi:hypothetical protein
MGRFRYIAFRAERSRFARDSVWAFNLAPAFPRRALTLCPQLCMGISPRPYTEIGLLFAGPNQPHLFREDTAARTAADVRVTMQRAPL